MIHGQSMSLEFPTNKKQMEASADMILIFIMFCPCVDYRHFIYKLSRKPIIHQLLPSVKNQPSTYLEDGCWEPILA